MKSVFKTIALAAILAVPIASFAAGDAAAGKDVYMKKCASCHAQTGEGKDAIAQPLKIKFKHLGSKEVQAQTDADLKKGIVEGTGKMKAVKDMDAKAIEDVIAFLRTLKAPK